MQDFPANSAKAKARSEEPSPVDRPKIEPITSATQARRKRGLGRKFKSAFIEGDARMAVRSTTEDVVIPMIRDMLFEAMQSGFSKLIFGDSRMRRIGAPPSYSNVGRVNYQGMAQSTTKPPEPRMLSRQARTRMDFRDLIIPNRPEAEEVLEQLFEELSRYGAVSVGTLYALTGIQSSHVDQKWGWTNLRGSKIARLSDGTYVLDLPDPISLEY